MSVKNIIFLITLFLFSHSVFAQKEYRLNKVKFTGNKILSNEKLLNQINTQPKKPVEKVMFWKRNPEFTLFVLENDINRLKKYYNRNGFLNPEITYTLDTLRLHRINVFVDIKENEFVTINKLDLNFKGDTLSGELQKQISNNMRVKSGDRFVDDNVFNSEMLIKKTFANNGYPYSKTSHSILVLKDTLQANIGYNIFTGEKSYIGDISILGDSIIPKKFIKSNIEFKTGDLYNQQVIDKTQHKIFNTELFQYVIIRSLKDSVKENQIPVEIMVSELPRWIFETGIGYGTEDRLRLSLTVTRLNFLGGARKLILKAKTSYYTPYNFEVKFIQPNLFFQDLDFIVNPFYIREREQSYEIERLGGGLTLQYPLSKKWNTGLTYTFEKDNILDFSDLQLDATEIKHNKSLISWGTQFNSTKNILNPTSGTKINSNVSYSGLGHSAVFHYYKLDISVRNYFPLSPEVNLATKLKGGVMQAIQNDPETPLEDRYFAGGASSLRGWGRHDIYPINVDSTAIGGNTLLEGSIELRYPIYDIFRGALFVDFGNVWSNSYSYNIAALHYNLGVGLRVKTPIGPVRLDIATPILNDDFGFQFFISVGHSF